MANSTRGRKAKTAPSAHVSEISCSSVQLDEEDLSKLSEEGRVMLFMMNKKFDEILAKLEDKDRQITQLDEKNTALKQEIEDLKDRVDEVEALHRRDTVIFSGSGVSVMSGQVLDSHAIGDLLKQKLNYAVQPGDVLSAHRVGRGSDIQQPDKRSIMVKFSRPGVSDDIIKAGRTVKPPNLFVNENLTPARARLLFTLRQAKRRFPSKVNACGSIRGRVYVWMKAPSPDGRDVRVFIDGERKLNEFCCKSFGSSMDDMLKSNNAQ